MTHLEALFERAPDAVIGIDSEGNVIAWNAAAESLFGWSRTEASGRPVDALIVPDRYKQAHRHGLRRHVLTGKGCSSERRLKRTALDRNGKEFPVEMSVLPMPADEGGPAFYAFLRDLSGEQAHEKEQEMRRHEAQLLSRVAQKLLEDVSLEEFTRYCLREVCDLAGLSAAHVFFPRGPANERVLVASDIWHLADESYAPAIDATRGQRFAVGQGLPGRAWEAEQLVLSDSLDSETDVARHEIFAGIGLTCGVALPVSNSGRTYAVLEFFGTAEARLDAEILRLLRTVGTQLGLGMQRKEAAEQREILRREVAHRVGNSLAVLSSIYRSCARSARSVEELNASFLGRIMAVSRASRMTLSESLSDQNLKLLLKEATGLLPQQERIIIDAPDMTLASEAVLPLSLILHELSTNALKHGSVAHGGEVFLRVDVAPQCNEFRLSWIEQRELSVDLPPETEQRSGYGSTLIRAMVESRLNGSFTRTLTRDGFRFDAVLPLSEMQALHPAGEVSAASPAEAR